MAQSISTNDNDEPNDNAEKRYYTMGEVASELNVKPSLIRFWDKEFEAIQPKKNRQGNRLFTAKDLSNLKLIYHLVKERGFTLKGAQAKLKQNPGDTARNVEVVERLKAVRQALHELRKGL